jgi:hypothetical protein
LVTQDEDLGVLGHGIHPVDADCVKDAVDETVEKGERYGRRASFSASRLVKRLDE